jgi:hypothetical protein
LITLGRSLKGGYVISFCVFPYHPGSREICSAFVESMLHTAKPFPRETLRITVIEKGHNFFFQDLVEVLGVCLVGVG